LYPAVPIGKAMVTEPGVEAGCSVPYAETLIKRYLLKVGVVALYPGNATASVAGVTGWTVVAKGTKI
jgi:hypothetical protein